MPNKRTPELPLLAIPGANMRLVIWNDVDNVTYGTLVSTLIPEVDDVASLTYDPDAIYNEDDVALSEDKFWICLIDETQGVTPVEGVNWHQVARSSSGLVFWQAGLFVNQGSTVLFGAPGMVALYYLNVPAPFNSTNFATELTANKWAVVGSPSSIGLGDLFPNTYFVSPLGNDAIAAKGDFSKPFTPAGAAALAAAGDTISFLPGDYVINTNIAVAGVTYTTFGGNVGVSVTGAGVTPFDYDAIATSSLPIKIIGDFNFILNGAGSNVIRFRDAFCAPNTTIKVSNVELQVGNAFIVWGKDGGVSTFDFNVVLRAGFTGMVTKRGATLAIPVYKGSNMTCSITNESAAQAFTGYMTGFSLRFSYVGSGTGGLNDTYFEDGVILNLLIDCSNVNSVNYLSRNNLVRAKGGKYYQQSGVTNGQFDSCYIEAANTARVLLVGEFISCDVKQNGTTSFTFEGNSTGCTLRSASQNITIVKGNHINLTINDLNTDTFGFLYMYGEISLTAGSQPFVSNIFIYGSLTGNKNNGLIAMGFGNIYVSGKIKNTNAGTGARCIEDVSSNTVHKMTLDRCTLEAGPNADSSIYMSGAGVASEVQLKMYGRSYANKPLLAQVGTPGFTYIVGSAADFITDADVSISS